MMIPADAKSVVGGYWRLSRSQRALVSALAVVLIPACLALAYLLSDIWYVNQTKEKEFSAAAARDTLLLSSYDAAVKVFSLAQAAYMTPSLRDSLRPEFETSVTLLRTMASLYVSYLTDAPPEERTDLLQAFNRLWTRIDGLVARSERVFTTGSSGSAGALLPNNAASLVGSPSAFFSSMRLELDHVMRAEMMVHLRLVGHLRAELERTTIRGFIVALVLFSVGTVLAILILRRNRLSERRRRRYETVLEASLNPIELVDREGRVTYVNPAFERMMGLDAKDLIGTNLFEHVETAHVSRSATEIWREAARELEASKAWTGEVKVRREGKPSQTTLLIISPVLNVDGGFLEAVGIHHDVTERRELARKFEETEEKYHSIVEGSLDGITIIQNGTLVFANDSSAKIFGYDSADQMQGSKYIDIVAPSNRFMVIEEYEGKTAGEDLLRNFEMKGLTRQGKVVDLEMNARLVSWNGRLAVQASFRDITKRKALEREQALWLWEQETMSTIDRKLVSSVNLQVVLDAISFHAKALTRADWAGVVMVDAELNQARWRSVIGNRIPVPADPIQLQNEQMASARSMEHVVLKNMGDLPVDNLTLPFQGEGILSAARFPLIVEQEARGQLVVGYRRQHDFAQREIRLLTSLAEKSSIALANAQIYDNLLSRERDLEQLSGARVMAQEEERRRIAREIHDSLGQMLTAIKFNVEILEDAAELQSEEERRRVADIKSLLDTAMAEAREISYNLMPSVLLDFGLVPALQFLGDQFQKRNELRVQVHTRGVEGRLDTAIEIGLYRIAQEALNNIAKHAEAHEVNVQLIGDSDAIRLLIDDDGKGFHVGRTEAGPSQRRGMGLVGMRERAASFNGVFVLDSQPGRGTEIIVEIPRVVQNVNG
jgi:PAS domain S-box-containing protein